MSKMNLRQSQAFAAVCIPAMLYKETGVCKILNLERHDIVALFHADNCFNLFCFFPELSRERPAVFLLKSSKRRHHANLCACVLAWGRAAKML